MDSRALPRAHRTVLILAISGISSLAWAYTVWLSSQMGVPEVFPPVGHQSMGGMNMPEVHTPLASNEAATAPAFRQWAVFDSAFVFVMWVVMMVGMMTPSVTPMVLLYAVAGRNAAANGRPLAATGWFFSGYLSAWIVFSLAATGAQWSLSVLALLSPMEGTSSLFGGIVLIAAGLYQWSSLKNRCLSQCQSPLGFLMRHGGFRNEPLGALRLGAEHGLYCVGCCWMLMALLFVGGVMNVMWIAGLALLILLEKLVPSGRLIPQVSGAAMAAAGLVILSRNF